jgi:hypothetical protein
MSVEERFHVSGTLWPVRSPGLTVQDLFLRRFLKGCVCKNRPHTHTHTIQELKRAVGNEFATINQKLLRRVFDSFVNRLTQWVAREGGHLQAVIHQK